MDFFPHRRTSYRFACLLRFPSPALSGAGTKGKSQPLKINGTPSGCLIVYEYSIWIMGCQMAMEDYPGLQI